MRATLVYPATQRITGVGLRYRGAALLTDRTWCGGMDAPALPRHSTTGAFFIHRILPTISQPTAAPLTTSARTHPSRALSTRGCGVYLPEAVHYHRCTAIDRVCYRTVYYSMRTRRGYNVHGRMTAKRLRTRFLAANMGRINKMP